MELKDKYNKLLKRFWTALEYFDNPEIPMDKKERWLPEYESIGKQLNEILFELKQRGIKYTKKQVLEGF